MSKYIAGFAILAAAFFVGVSPNFADIKVEGVKCVVATKRDAKEANSLEYRGGKVFFCCMNCPKAFSKDTKKFAASANRQLVATGQAEQVKCPFTGRDLNPDTKISVDGANVCFCCNNCKGKAEKAEGPDQVNLIFNDKAFDKGFKVKASE